MNPVAERHFFKWVQAQRGKPYEWGECDCNTLVLDYLDFRSGDCLSSLIRGKYSDEDSAAVFCEEFGRTLEDLIKAAGCKQVKRNFQQVGDILLVKSPSKPWHQAHICLGSTCLSVEPGGTVRFYRMRDFPKRFKVWRWARQ